MRLNGDKGEDEGFHEIRQNVRVSGDNDLCVFSDCSKRLGEFVEASLGF